MQDLANGRVVNKSYFYKEQLDVECDENYQEKEKAECQLDKTWSHQPECILSVPAVSYSKAGKVSILDCLCR